MASVGDRPEIFPQLDTRVERREETAATCVQAASANALAGSVAATLVSPPWYGLRVEG
jgi:hypothetical protein